MAGDKMQVMSNTLAEIISQEAMDNYVEESIEYLIATHQTGVNDAILARVRQIHTFLKEHKQQLSLADAATRANARKNLSRLETYLRNYCIVKNIDEARLYREQDIEKAGSRNWLRKLVAMGVVATVIAGSGIYAKQTKYPTANAHSTNQLHVYTVKRGETANKISQKIFGTENYGSAILEYNRLNNKKFSKILHEKEEILIPKKDWISKYKNSKYVTRKN